MGLAGLPRIVDAEFVIGIFAEIVVDIQIEF